MFIPLIPDIPPPDAMPGTIGIPPNGDYPPIAPPKPAPKPGLAPPNPDAPVLGLALVDWLVFEVLVDGYELAVADFPFTKWIVCLSSILYSFKVVSSFKILPN